MLSRAFAVALLMLAMGTGASSLTAQASDSSTVPAITPIPRAARPVMMVSAFEFTATPSKDDMAELNTLGGALFALKGGDPTARMTQTQNNLGKAAAGIMMERLVATGQFRVLERAALEQVKGEQALVASNAAEAGQGVAQQAKLLGAKYVVTGQITKFGKKQEKKGGLFGVVTKAAVGIALESQQTSYIIAIAARVVDASTGEVIASFTSDGVAVGNKSRGLGGVAAVSGLGLGGGGGSAASGERETKIAESIQISVDRLVLQMIGARERGDLVP